MIEGRDLKGLRSGLDRPKWSFQKRSKISAVQREYL